jgi:hypothetical protein
LATGFFSTACADAVGAFKAKPPPSESARSVIAIARYIFVFLI